MSRESQPKYQDVKDFLLASIDQGELIPGQKAPSENELSRRFGISRLTARHALTELVSEGILLRQQGSGTYVRERNRRIGVCMTYVDSYIFPDILKGIDEVLRKHQYILVLTCSNNETAQEEKVLGNLLEQNLDGLIWEPARSALRDSDDRMLLAVRRSGLPTVMINGSLDFPEAGAILTADAAGMGLLADYLFSLGHRKFAGLFCRDLIQGTRRCGGLLAALKALNLQIEPDHLLWFDSRDLNHGFAEKVAPWLRRLLNDRVTALCCFNDQIAQMCGPILRKINCKVPHDLSLTGFDAVERLYRNDMAAFNNEMPAAEKPWLTTVTHPCAQLGRLAAERLIAIMHHEEDAGSLKLDMQTELIIGGSTDLPRQDWPTAIRRYSR